MTRPDALAAFVNSDALVVSEASHYQSWHPEHHHLLDQRALYPLRFLLHYLRKQRFAWAYSVRSTVHVRGRGMVAMALWWQAYAGGLRTHLQHVWTASGEWAGSRARIRSSEPILSGLPTSLS